MRFSFGKKDVAPRWVDSAALGWVPEEPLDAAPKSTPAPMWRDDDTPTDPVAHLPDNVIALLAPQQAAAEPDHQDQDTGPSLQHAAGMAAARISRVVQDRFEDLAAQARSAMRPKPRPARRFTPVPALRDLLLRIAAPPAPKPPIADEALPTPANTNRTPRLALPGLFALRLCIGLSQGLALFVLVQGRSLNLWPGSDPTLFAALSLALLLAPLVLLDALGEIETSLLLAWTGVVAAALAALGLYHHDRLLSPDAPHTGFALTVLAALMLMVAQSLLRAGLHDGKMIARYRSYADTAWTLVARLVVWAVLTGIAWALIGSGNSLLNWMRDHYPQAHVSVEPSLLILPCVGMASAAAFAITAAGSRMRRWIGRALLACCAVSLPMLAAVSLAAIAAHVFVAPLSSGLLLALALLLVVSFNASYRDGQPRALLLRLHELVAAVLIVALVALAATALGIRVAAFGWTPGRIIAAAGMSALGGYGLLYVGAGLIGIGSGRWMQRVETANLLMAPLLIAGCLALTTPLADPLKLAVAAQTYRLESGRIDPAAFDFAWLRRDGGRFGQEALLAMTQSPAPAIAREAAITLTAPPGRETPAPTQIGANITVRTPGARLPNSLLQQNWAGTAAVPPCLTRPALSCDAWFLDLDGDGRAEILLVYGNQLRWWAAVMKDAPNGWIAAATLHSPACRGALAAMRAGGVAPVNPLSAWRDVLVAGMRLTPMPAPQAELPCPTL